MENRSNPLTTDYKSRMNRVFEYIDENLDSDLSLDVIADIAHFSPYHFHRVFKGITQETLNDYITRRRIEKAAADLLHKATQITQIALTYGFTNNATFTRAFKRYYGVSPTAFRKEHPHKFSKIRQVESKNGKAYPDREKYLCIIDNLKNWITMNAKIEVKEVAAMELAYVSCIGPQNLGRAFQTLMQWATPRGLMENDHSKVITIYHDSFKVTEYSKVRISAALSLPEKMETSGAIGTTHIAPGRYIIGSFFIGQEEFEQSWTGLFLWMNENGYTKRDDNPFEVYHTNFNEHPEQKCQVDFYIPVES